MLKNIVKIEFIINERPYLFICDNDSPLEHIKEALFQCQKYVGAIEDNVKAQLAQRQAEEKPTEEVQDVG